MIDDQTILIAIDKSPLSPEDKEHWKMLLTKLKPTHRERLLHSLTAKTEISRAVGLIEKALTVINEAEAEAEDEIKKEKVAKEQRQEMLQDLEEIKQKEDEIILDEEELKQKHQETKSEIERLRQELKALSVEVHGQAPPSYSKQPSQSIPQLEK